MSDTTPPGTITNLSCPTRSASLAETPLLRWTAATDEGGSGISHYELAIGTSAGATDVATWSMIGNVTEYAQTNLSLSPQTKY